MHGRILFVNLESLQMSGFIYYNFSGQWIPPSTPLSSTSKSDHHDITEILLKVVLNTHSITWPIFGDNNHLGQKVNMLSDTILKVDYQRAIRHIFVAVLKPVHEIPT